MSPDRAPRKDEHELVEALRRGDQAAYSALVAELTPALTRLALGHVSSRAVADEVVQDTWLGVLDGIDHFQERSALRTWIIQILLNKARTRGVREKRTVPFSFLRRRDDPGDDGPSVDPSRFQGQGDRAPGHWARPPIEWQTPEARLETNAARQVLLEAIAALPERQREVITLRDVLGYSSDEVRNALEVSETNQRVLLHRARSKVRAALEAHTSEVEA